MAEGFDSRENALARFAILKSWDGDHLRSFAASVNPMFEDLVLEEDADALFAMSHRLDGEEGEGGAGLRARLPVKPLTPSSEAASWTVES